MTAGGADGGANPDAMRAPDDPLHLRSLVTLGPAPADPMVSLRCALGIFVPLLVRIGLDRLDLAVFVVFAAFTNIFGRVPGHIDRLIAQLKVGGTFWVTMLAAWLASVHLIDYSSDDGLWTLVVLTAVVSGVVTLWAGFQRIRPAGSLFHIFCFAAIASYPATATLGDGMFAASATVAFALLLGQAGRLWPSRRTPWTVTPPRPLTAEQRRSVWLSAGLHAAAVLVAGAFAIIVTPHLGVGHRYWALVAAVVPLAGHTSRHGVARGLHRIAGTLAGLGLLALVMLVGPPVWVLVLLMGAAQFGAEIFVNRNYFLAQTFVTPMALLGTAIGKELTLNLFVDRVVETVIGASVGMAAVLLVAWLRRRGAVQDAPPPDRMRP